jgi:hypothetical protein
MNQTDKKLFECLKDYRWRFTNLYWIKPAELGKAELLFNPKPEQWEILDDIYLHGNIKIAILKARQLGFSTLLALICLDMALFKEGFTAGIVDQTKDAAESKMNMVRFAFERLPADLRQYYKIEDDNRGTLSFRSGTSEDSISKVYGGVKARGGTHQLLWISEWGAIQLDDVKRSEEIMTGALPSAKEGIIVVETTWKGGKSGLLYSNIVEPALQLDERYKSKEDWRIRFFGWHGDETYMRDGDVSQISDDCNKYLNELRDKHGVELVPRQKLWYFKTCWPMKNKRYEEFPSVQGEIFLSPAENAIYAEWMDDALLGGRIVDYNLERGPTYAALDIGVNDLMTVTIFQVVSTQYRIYDHIMLKGVTVKELCNTLQRWERDNNTFFGKIFLPHDGNRRVIGKTQNKTVLQMMEECGMRHVCHVPVIGAVMIGIDQVRDRIPSMLFHASNLSRPYEFGSHRLTFLDAMNNYRFHPLDGKTTKMEPIHDIYSHPVDSLRCFAEADERGMVPKHATLQAIEDIEDEPSQRAILPDGF